MNDNQMTREVAYEAKQMTREAHMTAEGHMTREAHMTPQAYDAKQMTPMSGYAD